LRTSAMANPSPEVIGQCIASARRWAGLTQAALAKSVKINRVQIVRMEAGLTVPRLDEAVRLAEVLKVPLGWFASTGMYPRQDLRGIAIELHHLGIRDLEVFSPEVPGSFRHKEEILAIAVSGDRPEPRVIEAIPFLLARYHFDAWLVAAISKSYHDRRARGRIAWLSEITLALSRLGRSPLAIQTEASLSALIKRGVKAPEPDSLGHPATERLPPIWGRWNITYSGTMDDFLRRSLECQAAFAATPLVGGRGEL
jgi:DNA-binding XRE family transcriptional regulator